MSIVDLPTDVLGCVVRHLQPTDWQLNQQLDDVAAWQLCAACAARCASLWMSW